MIDRIIQYFAIFLALILVLPLHEFAHALIAVKCGDNTPKLAGRYTLNPLAHFDTMGLICFVLARFGWAKPVPVNPSNIKNYKWGSLFVAIAGVLANYLLAFLIYPLFILSLSVGDFGYFTDLLQYTLYFIFSLSLSFFAFNVLPIFPLDGFRIVEAFSKKRSKIYYYLRYYGPYILIFLMLLSVVAVFSGFYKLDILGTAIMFIVKYIRIPITAFWGLIL